MQKIVAVIALMTGVAHADRVPVAEAMDPGPAPMPPPRPPEPKPAAEIAQLGQLIGGTWKCSGAIAKLTITLVLDNAWIEISSAGITSDTTYDPIAKQWTTITRTGAAYAISTSLGEQDGVWTWAAQGAERKSQRLSKTKLELWTETNVRGSWKKTAESVCTKS